MQSQPIPTTTSAAPARISAADAAMVRSEVEKYDAVRRQQIFLDQFQKTGRILLSDPHMMLGIDHVPGIGMTDGRDIWFLDQFDQDVTNVNAGQMTLTEFVMTWLGILYHESAHILFTPRQSSKAMLELQLLVAKSRGVTLEMALRAVNILEDQRIETLFSAIFSPATRYFHIAVLRFLTADPTVLARAYPICYGRKFLPKSMRTMMRNAFLVNRNENLTVRIEAAIDAYLMTEPDVKPKLWAARVVKFVRLLKEAGLMNLEPTSGHESGTAKLPRVGEAEDELTHDAVRAMKDQANAEEEGEDEDGGQDGEEAEGTSAGDEGEDGDEGQGVGDGESDDADADGDDSEGSSSSPGMGTGGSDQSLSGDQNRTDIAAPDVPKDSPQDPGRTQPDSTSNTAMDKLRDKAIKELAEQLQEAMGDMAVKDDVGTMVNAISASLKDAERSVLPKRNAGSKSVPRREAVNAGRKIQQAVSQLRIDLEDGWVRQTNSGKVNFNRVMLSEADPSVIDIFDRWEESEEETATVECVIAFDISGSMGGRMQQASEAVWTIKKAFDALNIRTTVLAFGSSSWTLFQPDEKMANDEYDIFDTNGGTMGYETFLNAYRLISRSKETTKVFITITDGAIADRYRCTPFVDAMNARSDTITAMLGLAMDQHTTQRANPNCQVAYAITNPFDLVAFVERLVVQITKQAVKSAGHRRQHYSN